MERVNFGKKACAGFLLWAATVSALPAQTFTLLHTFDYTDGGNPYAALVQSGDGKLYGTTYSGGAYGGGTVFRITPSGALTTLYEFCAQDSCMDGYLLSAGLLQGTDGNFYGTTLGGGANRSCEGQLGCGTVFKITPSGSLTTLYSFCSRSACTDGYQPDASLIQAADGHLYGTTRLGGTAGWGTIFEITPSGKLTTLYSFCSQNGCTDGAYPEAALVQTTDGNFYGTTGYGGANGWGTVFRLTLDGPLTTLYSFCSQTGCPDGQDPRGALVQGTNGDFFGISYEGGANGSGTVFKITPSGTLTTLHSFAGYPTDGGNPYAALLQATDGALYGTTRFGGANAVGTVFRITPGGVLTTLHSFCSEVGCPDGGNALAGLVQDTNGRLYGTTSAGGTNGYGTVFNLYLGLGPFVETQPTSARVGKPVKILGTNLTGATSVSFNGAAAVFTVVSGTLIKTTVPVGATTGKVQVTTPSGTLTSNVNFVVAAVPKPLHEWTFNDGTAKDDVGGADGTLYGGATITNGSLRVGPGAYMKTSELPEDITTKTLVSWLKLASLDQGGGSGLTIENTSNNVDTNYFDAIDFAERTPRQWMAGSDYYKRSPVDNGGAPETEVNTDVMIAVVYGNDNSITIYRNGTFYAG